MVKLHTNHGVITLELDAAKAPKTVENFLAYVKSGHYDNTVFHRVIDGFMIQGGGFEPGMKQKPTQAQIENEANNGLKNERYSVAMAIPYLGYTWFFALTIIVAIPGLWLLGRMSRLTPVATATVTTVDQRSP